MTDRTELRRLLDEHLKAVGYHDVTESWFALARAAIRTLPDLLDQLDAAEAAERPAETVSETVPTRHEAPDVAELRRLAEAATPGPWTFEAPERVEVHIERELCRCSGAGDEYEFVSEGAGHHVHLWRESHIIHAGEKVVAGNYDYEDGGIIERRDRDYIAAANPATVLGLLDRLAHMTEARDNARAEVERLTALVGAARGACAEVERDCVAGYYDPYEVRPAIESIAAILDGGEQS